MDPLSIVAGAVGIADVCFRVGALIHKLHKDAGTVDDDLKLLENDLSEMGRLCATVEKLFQEPARVDSGMSEDSREENDPARGLRAPLKQALDDCGRVVRQLNDTLLKIHGNTTGESSSKIESLRKGMKKYFRESDLQGYHAQLSAYQSGLHMVISMINFQSIRDSRSDNSRSFEDLSSEVQRMDSNFQEQLESLRGSLVMSDTSQRVAVLALEQLQRSLKSSAKDMEPEANEYFDIPQRVSSIFTGRKKHLEELQGLFVPKPSDPKDRMQKRFIIHGLGGSGKTQFCCKFAQDNQESFWAIFWIDASTEQRAKETLISIAETARLDKDENAPLTWLSSLKKRWLLIIDNADDNDVSLEKYFPKGKRGNILVTTRNPAYRLHGNVGKQYYTFQGLKPEDATQLLLRAASIKPPDWDNYRKQAFVISKTLGFLALAIVHAGAAITDGACELEGYLGFYKRERDRVRDATLHRKGTKNETTVFATWEICRLRLEAWAAAEGDDARQQPATDALELLNIFAFFHWETIPFAIFQRAAKNLYAASRPKPSAQAKAIKKPTWSEWLRKAPTSMITFALKNRSPPVLPRVLSDVKSGRIGRRDTVEDVQDRMRRALGELTRMALVISNENSDSFYMHPLVHVWARERPEMQASNQALWAEAAGRTLAESILLPPLDSTTADENFHISLFPHVNYVRKYLNASADSISMNTEDITGYRYFFSWIKGLVPSLSPDSERILMYAKFSLVYLKSGHWEPARSLMEEVVTALNRYLGAENERARRASMLLSTIYWHLGQTENAKRLQSTVLQACVKQLGPNHLETFACKAEVGRSLWLMGRYTQAKKLQEEVLEGLSKRLPANDERVLEAKNDLAQTIQKFFHQEDFEKAYQLFVEAASGLNEIRGSDDDRTLYARMNISRVSMLIGDQRAEEALEIMGGVVQKMLDKCGEEHPYSLLAMVNQVVVLTGNGFLDEADAIMRHGLPIGERVYGSGHMFFQFGRHVFACLLAQRRCYAQAEALLMQIIECQRALAGRGDYHPDRLGAMIEMSRCCYKQGKISRSLEIAREAIHGFNQISTTPHPLNLGLQATVKRMEALDTGSMEDEDGEIEFPFTTFRYRDHN